MYHYTIIALSGRIIKELKIKEYKIGQNMSIRGIIPMYHILYYIILNSVILFYFLKGQHFFYIIVCCLAQIF